MKNYFFGSWMPRIWSIWERKSYNNERRISYHNELYRIISEWLKTPLNTILKLKKRK